MSKSSQDTDLASRVDAALKQCPVTDLHTHLYPPSFGGLMQSGIDPLLTYHYLAAETLKFAPLEPNEFFALSEGRQADLVWRTLFQDRSPLSEAAVGVLTCLQSLKLGTGPSRESTLAELRAAYALLSGGERVDTVFEAAGVRDVVMTNDPFNPEEREVWLKGQAPDARFHAALRLDPLLNHWPEAARTLKTLGYPAQGVFNAKAPEVARKFLKDWALRIKALYVAVSLDPSFTYPARSNQSVLLDKAVLPVCRELNLPLALMIGVKRQVNPALGTAGDALGRADLDSVAALCSRHPHNKFMLTALSAENQHECAVLARKFKNLLLFGCWWFLNIPSQIESITRMRMELLGTGFAPQHSDARVLEQLIYKWGHTRRILGKVLTARYEDLERAGWRVEDADIRRDVQAYLGGNFRNFLGLGDPS